MNQMNGNNERRVTSITAGAVESAGGGATGAVESGAHGSGDIAAAVVAVESAGGGATGAVESGAHGSGDTAAAVESAGGGATGAVKSAAHGSGGATGAVKSGAHGSGDTVGAVAAAAEPAGIFVAESAAESAALAAEPAVSLIGKAAAVPTATLTAESLDWRFTLFLPVMGFLFIEWVAESSGISVTVFTLAFAAGALLWLRARDIRPPKGVYLYLAWILLASVSFALYQNPLTEEPLLLLMTVTVPYFFAAACGIRTENRLGGFLTVDAWDALLAVPFGGVFAFLSVSGTAIKRGRFGKGILCALLGIILTLPVTVAVGHLLRTADAAFSTLWLRLDQQFMSILTENITQVLLSLPITLYLYGLFYGTDARKGAPKRTPEQAAALKDRCRLLPGALVAGSITPLLCIYALFFFSQTAYFLDAFKGLLPAGMIYSEYARRGFFELCAVSGINLVFIGILALFTLRGKIMGKIYTVLLSLFSVALIAISLRKMLLYIDYYGFTPKRLGTSWFMVFLLLVFLLNIASVFRPALNTVKGSAAAGAVMLLLFCSTDISGLIADYNVNAYRNGSLLQLDLAVLQELGDGTTPRLLDVLRDETMKPSIRETARQILSERVDRLNRRYGAEKDWRNWTLAGSRSEKLLQEHRILISNGLLED
jgi:cbb3-type cytochrome oxidase subunit 3